NSSVNARRFVLSADQGKIDVYGKINASGVKGGEIALYSKGQLTLHATAELDASATGAGQNGGTVTLSTQTFALDGDGKPLGVNLNGGAIKVGGGTGGLGGTLQLRAPRNIANNDLAIAAINSVISGARAIRAEGYRTYPDADNKITSSDFATSGDWYKDAESFMKQTGTIRTRLNMVGNSAFALAPGIDIESATDLTLSNDWSVAAWRYDPNTGAIAPAGQLASGLNASGNPLLAGVLTLRAAGDLKLDSSLSDGFDTALATGTAQGLNAWSYRLVAGADVGASPLTVKKSAGNISLVNSKLIRTGRGDIDIAAGGNLTLGNDASVIYTAGSQAAAIADFAPPASGKSGKSPYLDGGGHVYIRVGGDLIGKVANKGSQQLVNNWLFRQGELNADGSFKKQTSWWLRPDLFKSGIATFGGGDIVLEADGKIENLSAAAPTTGRVAVDPITGTKLDAVVLGGGDILVRAGGDILSGVYHLGRGEGRIITGGKIASASNTFGTALSLQDGRFHVQGSRGVFLEAVFNPTLAPQANANASSSIAGGSEPSSFFSTYANTSAVHLAALSGKLAFSTKLLASNNVFKASKIEVNTLLAWIGAANLTAGAASNDAAKGWSYYPGTLRATAFAGDLETQAVLQYPAANGQLALLASGDIKADHVVMSDADLALLPGLSNPVRAPAATGSLNIFNTLIDGHGSLLLHKSDAKPVYIVAGKSIAPFAPTQGRTFNLTTPKQTHIHADGDIVNLNAAIQHLSPADLSTIAAGRKLVYTVNDEKVGIRIAGPGELLATAGNDVDLGKSGGIQSIANTVNNFLPPTGASVTVGAGFGGGVDVAAFIALYIDPAGSKASPETKAALTAYMRQVKSDVNLSDTDAWAAFAKLDKEHQTPFAFRIFSNELRESRKGPERGDAAIAVLFPGQHYDGDLLMFESQIRTTRDSSIDLLVPGGEINAGLAGAATTRDIGIITEKGGEIRAFADAGFYVNQSKVITQYGSDIVVWVTDGDIDAGRGSTTALSVPERIVSTDVDGNTTQEFKGVAAGSGIRAQTYDPDGPSGPGAAPDVGTVVLRAHRGTLNAADAGIEAGNLDVSALVVLGTDAIQVSGSVSGVNLNTSSLAPPPSPSVDQKSSEESTKSLAKNIGDTQKALEDTKKALANFKPSFITVEVVGFGETGSANASECRREDGSIDPACKQRLKEKGI
ncbi:MAG: filamentous hemagglutinin family protein, partial [Burkholderiales bacterium]|nr:filamentous hemagglutinin family protein [Burkholderiales bacterium]